MKIVLLPGLDGTSISFNPLLEVLPQKADVVVVSYPDTKLSYGQLVSFF